MSLDSVAVSLPPILCIRMCSTSSRCILFPISFRRCVRVQTGQGWLSRVGDGHRASRHRPNIRQQAPLASFHARYGTPSRNVVLASSTLLDIHSPCHESQCLRTPLPRTARAHTTAQIPLFPFPSAPSRRFLPRANSRTATTPTRPCRPCRVRWQRPGGSSRRETR